MRMRRFAQEWKDEGKSGWGGIQQVTCFFGGHFFGCTRKSGTGWGGNDGREARYAQLKLDMRNDRGAPGGELW